MKQNYKTLRNTGMITEEERRCSAISPHRRGKKLDGNKFEGGSSRYVSSIIYYISAVNTQQIQRPDVLV